jgi:uncharacterized membrane protein YccC
MEYSPPPNATPAGHAVLNAALTRARKGLPFSARVKSGLYHGCLSSAAALIAYAPAEIWGLKEAFWGAITAIAVLQTEFQATQTTARDQCFGAIIGGSVGVGILVVSGEHLATYVIAVVAAMVACGAFNVASASRLSGTTATIIMLVPHDGPPSGVLISRVSEVALGVCAAIAVAWIASRFTARKSASPQNQ